MNTAKLKKGTYSFMFVLLSALQICFALTVLGSIMPNYLEAV